MIRHLRPRLALAGALAAGSLAAGLGVAHVATSHPAAIAASPSPSASPSGSPSPGSPGRHPQQRECPAGGVAGQLLGIVTRDTGLPRQQVLDQLRAGKTINDIAGDKAGQIQQDALAALKARLDAAVAASRLTPDRESQMLAQATARLQQAMSENLSGKIPPQGAAPRCGHGGRGGRGGQHGLLATLVQVTAQQTGLSEAQVRDQLRAGKTIEQIAGDKAAAVRSQVLSMEQQELSTRLDQAMSTPRRGGGPQR